MKITSNFWNVFQQSFGFLILFIAYNSSENLQSRIMEELGFGNLGFYNVAAVQFCAVLTTLLATTVLSKFGFRISHAIGSLGITFWILCSALPARKKYATEEDLNSGSILYSNGFIYFINILSSCLCGMACAVLWTVQGNYTSDCSTDKDKGKYFGLFWILYMSSQIFGNMIASFVLGNLKESTFFYIMTAIAFSSIFVFATLRKPQKQEETSKRTESSQQSPNSSRALQDINLNLQNRTIDESTISQNFSGGNSSTVQLEQRIEENLTSLQMAKKVLQCMTQKKMLMFLPQLAWTGISLGYYAGMLVLQVTSSLESTDPDTASQYKKGMMTMVAFGFGEVFGGPCVGLVVDKYGNRAGVFVNLFIITITTLITVAYLMIFKFSWLAFAMTFLWGFQDGTTNTHCQGILGFEFENSTDPFAVLCFVQGLFCFIFEMIQSQISGQQNFLIYAIVIGILGIAMNGVTYFFDFKRDAEERQVYQQHKEEEDISVILDEDLQQWSAQRNKI